MSNYPEKIPESFSDYENFQFSLKASSGLRDELKSQLDIITERIDKIVNTITVNDMPLIKFVLQSSHEKSELKKFAKAVDRVADLIEVHDQIQSKLSIIEAAQQDPKWFAFAFGDFTQEIDKDIQDIFN